MAERSLSACRAEIKANPGKFYVYILSRPDGVPFYVGCGRGNRIAQHIPESNRNRTHPKSRVIRGIIRDGGSVGYQIESWHPEFSGALAREVELIASIGRLDLSAGPLVNLTVGGDGVTAPALEVRKKQSAAMSRRWSDPAERERLTKSMQRGYSSSEIRRAAEAQQSAKMHVALAELRKDPSWQKDVDARRLHAQSTEEGRARRAAISKAMWADPAMRERILRRCAEARESRSPKT